MYLTTPKFSLYLSLYKLCLSLCLSIFLLIVLFYAIKLYSSLYLSVGLFMIPLTQNWQKDISLWCILVQADT